MNTSRGDNSEHFRFHYDFENVASFSAGGVVAGSGRGPLIIVGTH